MSVPSFPFLAFALLAAAAYNLPWIRRARPLVLLAVNLALLASFAHRPQDLAPFALFLALGYGAIRFLRSGRPRALTALMVGVVLFAFVWLKKYSFVPQALWLPTPYVTVGLSYVFFRVMHLVVDAGQEDLEVAVPPLAYVNYCLNFLSLVAGPIQRYEDYARQQAEEPEPVDAALLVAVAERVVLGLFKVLVISMLLLEQQTHAVSLLSEAPSRQLLVALEVVLIYPLYLYANFSGYCDVVIALARLFRLELPENFNQPFRSTNFIEFWNRWHITLSSWLRTYVFSPLMMRLMRISSSSGAATAFSAFAFFVTFFLVGAWHGQTTEFLFFGLLQGGGVAGNKLYQTLMAAFLGQKGYRTLGRKRLYAALCRGMTFVWFGFTLLWFWSDWRTIGRLAAYIGPLGGAAAALVAIVLSATILEALAAIGDRPARLLAGRPARVAWVSAQATAIWLIASLLAAPPPEIVYKTF